MDYTQIISAVIALISALVSAFLIPWIKTKIDADKLQTLRTYVEIGVKAAEQQAIMSARLTSALQISHFLLNSIVLTLLLELVQKLFYIAVSAQLDVFLPGNQALGHWHFLRHDGQPEDRQILLVLMLLHFPELFVDLG